MNDPHARTASGPVRLGRLVVNLLLVAVTLGAAAYLVPSLMGYERYVITGGSMSGTIEKGSLVFERRVPVDELKVGDVITYLPPPDSGVRNLVTHRIVALERGANGVATFRTQGDANPDPDPWTFSLTAASQPVVSFSLPRAGYVFIALADRETRILVVGLPAGAIALWSLVQLIEALRPRRSGSGSPSALPAPAVGRQVDASPTAA